MKLDDSRQPEHNHEINQNQDSWLNRHRWISYGALIVIAYYLLTEHREHVFAYIPYLILAACPFMHMFMHGSHGHQKNHDHRNQEQEKKS